MHRRFLIGHRPTLLKIYTHTQIYCLFPNRKTITQCAKTCSKSKKYQFASFNPLSYCFKAIIGFDVKTWFANCPVPRLIRWYNKTRWYNNRILRKGYSVTEDFSWIENYKLMYSRQRLLWFILLSLCRFSDTKSICNLRWVAKWDKWDRVFKQ